MILLSGGFDPVHVGHVRMIQDAKQHGDVYIAVNSDAWLMRKKGFVFMPFNDRCEVLRAMGVKTLQVNDDDNTVCSAIRDRTPDYFGNGGDRTKQNTPELDVCEELNITPIFGLGGDKVESSSDLVSEKRVWGSFEVIHRGRYKVKILRVKPNHGISIQSHEFRNEHWVFPHDDEYAFIEKGEVHCLHNPTDEMLEVVEVQTGDYLEEDDEEKYFTI